MSWHGYIILVPVSLTAPQQTAIHNQLILLGPGTADQPCYLMHYNTGYTNDVYEALYDDAEITPAAFKTLVATALSVDESTLTTSETYSCMGIGITVRDATGERVRFLLAGKQYTTHAESLSRVHEGYDRMLSNPTSYPMVGNEAFNPATLNATARSWHTTLLAQTMSSIAYWSYFDDSPPDDNIIEMIWTNLNALLAAFRVTTDLHILDMIDVLAEKIWISVNTGSWADFYGGLSDTRISAIVNQLARVYQLNAAKTSPGSIDYGARATQWATYVDVTHVPAVGTTGYNIRHATIAGIQGMYYNWIRTGRAESWLDSSWIYDLGFEPYRSRFQIPDGLTWGIPDSVQLGIYEVDYGTVKRKIWEHLVPDEWSINNSLGPQAINYAQYTFLGVLDMHLEGVWPWNSVSEITQWARSIEYVMAPGIDNYLDSIAPGATHSGAWANWRLLYWSVLGAGRWSSAVRALGDSVWALKPPADSNVIVPSLMIVATI